MIIELKGTPYEQGKQQGNYCVKLIQNNILELKNSINKSKIDKNFYQKLILKNLNFLEKNKPEIIDEMQGIADGSGIDFHDISLINIPLYFLIGDLTQECSSILATGNATIDNKTYLVKNRDMRDKIKHVIVERTYIDGDKVTEVNGAGIITYPGNGINKNGLAISTTGVWPKMIKPDLSLIEKSEILLNINFLLKNCCNIDDVIYCLNNYIRMNGMNFVVATPNNSVAIEITKDNIYVEKNLNGLIARTNHYTTDELNYLNPNYKKYSSTYMRYNRIISFLKEKYGDIRFQEMLQIASDHKNSPENCICRHGLGNDANTIYSSMIIVEDNQIWTSLGNPCESLILSQLKEE